MMSEKNATPVKRPDLNCHQSSTPGIDKSEKVWDLVVEHLEHRMNLYRAGQQHGQALMDVITAIKVARNG
jgi:hypothetical protein